MGRKSKEQLLKEKKEQAKYKKRFERLDLEYKKIRDLFDRFQIKGGNGTWNGLIGYSYILRVRVEIQYKEPGHVAYKKPRISDICFYCDEDINNKSIFGYDKYYSLLNEVEDISFQEMIDIVTNWLLTRKQSQIEILNNMENK